MSRKKKQTPQGKSLSFTPTYSWLPAFFAGLCVGLLIHFIPGMDVVLGEARRANHPQEQVASDQPILWRPQITKHSKP